MSRPLKAFEKILLAQLRVMLSFGRGSKRLLVGACDALICVMAIWLSFSLRLGEWMFFAPPVLKVAAAALPLFPAIFVAAGIYRTIFRFAGLRTVISIAMACAVLSVPMIALFMINTVPGVPRTIAIMFPAIFFMGVAVSRIIARYLFVEVLNQREFQGSVARVLIYGAGFSGQQLAVSLRSEPGMWMRGFIDDDVRLDGQRIDGVPIAHASRLADRIEQLDIDTILLAMPKISRARQREIIDSLQDRAVRVLTLPVMTQIVDGHVSIDDLREIAVEELLGREPVAPNELLLGRTILGKTVMVTGAGGSIGSELCRQILAIGPARLVLVEMTEHALYAIEQELGRARADGAPRASMVEIVPELANVADAAAIGRIVQRHAPDTLFHAAAYKHVPLVEHNPVGGLRNNIFGTLHTALAAEQAGVSHFVLVSTDKAVRPTNVMGASKRICEQVLQGLNARGSRTRFAMVRFGNVLGSSGSVVPLFREQIRGGGPVTVTDREMTRYFMTIPEAAQLVIQACAMARGGDVFLLDMGAPVKIADLAETMIKLSGRTVRSPAHPDGDIEIVEVGLRPGEKLYEELLIGEDAQKTTHSRIMRSEEAHVGWDTLERELGRMRAALERGAAADALSIMRTLVPEYAVPVDSVALARKA